MFLKINLNKILFTVVIIGVFFVSKNAFAFVDNISKVVFITSPQVINTSEISQEITVQAWNNSENRAEKMDISGGKLSLTSSSQYGEFSASATKWEKVVSPLTINSNWTGRTFYYKNSVEGTDIITATLTVGDKNWVATQNIVAGLTVSTTTDNTSTSTQATSTAQTATSTNATTTQVVINTIVKYVSVHSNPEDLSDYDSVSKFEISAGRERVGYVGIPIKFSAKNNSSKITNCPSSKYVWTYGDGTKDAGENITHIYKIPGEYNVVLNGYCGSEIAVSRTKVKVLVPEVYLSLISSGDLEIVNFGKAEINIGEWNIVSSSTGFILPEDTIISASSSLILSKEISKILAVDNYLIKLLNPAKEIIFSIENVIPKKLPELVSNNSEQIVINISKEDVSNFTNAFLQNYKREAVLISLLPNRISTFLKESQIMKNSTSSAHTSEVATVFQSTESQETEGFWKKFFKLPARGIKAVARVFYDII